MKKYLSLAALAIAFVGCTSDEFVGKMPQAPEANGPMAINFGSTNASITRAEGPDAAEILGKKFRVFGTSTKKDENGELVIFDVFNNYVVKYVGNAGDPNDSTNTNGWSYLGYNSLTTPSVTQELKYWDMSAVQYDFIAFAGLPDNLRVTKTDINRFPVDLNSKDTIFISDRVTSTRDGFYTGTTSNHQYMPKSKTETDANGNDVQVEPNPVTFNFKRLAAKVRVGIYETVPGYAVKDVKFYYGDHYLDQAGTSTTTDLGLDGSFPTIGEMTISYDENNKVLADFKGDTIRYMSFGDLAYTKALSSVVSDTPQYLKEDGSSDATGDAKFLSTTSAIPSWAQKAGAADPWQTVIPFASSKKNLVLRVDFTLVPLDGNNSNLDKIEVKGASAVVPQTYARWKPNFAYTYIFKISDKTNGTTGTPNPNPSDPDNPNPNPSPSADGLFPITFDATVSSYEDYNQETITGITNLGGDAITTYSETSNVTNANEYYVGETITASSYSHGQWSLAFSPASDPAPTEKQVADNNTYPFKVIAGETEVGKTIDQCSVTSATFKATEINGAGYYIIKLRYLPIGLEDIDKNYVNVFKVVKVVNKP